MSVSSLEETHLSQDLLHPSIHSQRAGPIPSQIETVSNEEIEQEGLVILPAEQDVVSPPKENTTTHVSPTIAARSTVAESNKMKYPSELISLNQTRILGQNILKGILVEAHMKGFDNSLKHRKKGAFLTNLHLISFSDEGFLNYLQQPNIQKFKNTFSAALKLLSTIVSGHKHSPGDADQGEEYPAHLVDVIKVYKKVLARAEDTNKSASKENYNVQMDIVGYKAPIGVDSTASALKSTREANGKSGHTLVERVKGKGGSAYHTPGGVINDISGEATESSKKEKNGRKKSKIDVKELISASNDSRSDMAKAVTNLAEMVKPTGASNGEIEFKKDVWEDKKSYCKMKHDSKKDKAVLDMLKADRDEAIAN